MNSESSEALSLVVLEIKESNEYKKVLLLKEEIKKDRELVKLIDDVKTLQKKLVNSNYNALVDEELKNKNSLLDKNSKFVEYNYYLEIVNKKIDLVRDMINDYFSDLVS